MSTLKTSGVVFCFLIASLLLNWETNIVSAQQPAGAIAIQGATVITGTGSPSIRNGTVVIENGRITGVGPRNEVKGSILRYISARLAQADRCVVARQPFEGNPIHPAAVV